MSLLIKALDKAQEQARLAKLKQAQTVQNNSTLQKNSQTVLLQTDTRVEHKLTTMQAEKREALSLEPSVAPSYNEQINVINQPHLQGNLSPEQYKTSSQNKTNSQKPTSPKITSANYNPSAQSAANVFTAKKLKTGRQSKIIFTITIVGLLTLLAIGIYFYQLKNNKFAITSTRPLPLPTDLHVNASKKLSDENVIAGQLPSFDTLKASEKVALKLNVEAPVEFRAAAADIKSLEIALKKEKSPEKLTNGAFNRVVNNNNSAVFKASSLENTEFKYSPANMDAIENSLKSDEILMEAKIIKNNTDQLNNKRKNNNNNAENAPSIASKSASMNISKSQSQNSINPILMSAYNAYNVGNDGLALKQYKQVLQRDVRNSDALLGLGAIAQRQGRLADATSWYSKVLEVDPKNSIAMTYLFENQPQNNEQNTETQLKNLLVKQPNDANLHALFGNFYAQNNQWPAAQQAYFDAFRLNASAENALNLAVSLDQMGKPALALPYYQQALVISEVQAKIGGNQIDRISIEARIKAIN